MKEQQPKRERFQNSEKAEKSGRATLATVAGLAMAAIVLYMMFNGGTTDQEGESGVATASPVAAPVGQDFRIPLAEMSDGRARFYNYNANGKTVRFFAIKSSDGVVRAALDACIICFEARRGYRQQGDDMVCNKCNRRFRLVDVNVKSGGCNPIPLTRSVEGHMLAIKAGDLEKGTSYF